MRISDWSSEVCSSDLLRRDAFRWWADRQHREVCCGRNGLHVQSHDRPRERRLFELAGAKGLAGRRYGLRARSPARGYTATGLDEPAQADRKSVGVGKSGSEWYASVVRRIIKKK